MELFFLAVLILLMVAALTSGFPVAFALPGSAIGAIGLAALFGWLFEGDVSAYFAQGGPIEWLSAGVTNFRSLYWDVERDTLIAIPLFVFMGIMLQRSKVAEDLLVKMAQLFGPIPGGLGISVVFVGALLAATTGIVGATVIAMGLISLPAMLRNNYSKPLATGTICASGTLGQIIPPSIVLIILADQLASAADQASTARKAEYKAATGEFSMPSEFDIVSASAGDMFMGAFIPGLVLVAIYMLYILVSAILRPKTAPPVPYDGKLDRRFALSVLLALVPPLTLIFAVLGSIIMGIATVNQAGAIGAIGAMIMGGYRLAAGKRHQYTPAALAVVSILLIFIVLAFFDINVKNVRGTKDVVGIILASIATTGLLVAVGWSGWRAYKIDDTLNGVMLETAKTTSMVFIILIGAAMLTSAFRGFGGEELVKHFLTGLPGGFWTQFIVVMVVIFLLGFFLDFIEIAVVVVPIVAPILLMDPSANITAVWLGVMVGLNIQTSFLTPPFGFALFYLRGVAPPDVRTLDIYRGAAAFIALQIGGLAIAGTFPSLVNYLPNRVYLTAETAPPPVNPRLQECLEEYLFEYYDENAGEIRESVQRVQSLDISYLPEQRRNELKDAFGKALATFELVKKVREADEVRAAYVPDYRPVHFEVRSIQTQMRKIDDRLEELEKERVRLTRSEDPPTDRIEALGQEIEQTKADKTRLADSIPKDWKQKRKGYTDLANAEKQARGEYRRNVDGAYEPIRKIRTQIEQAGALSKIDAELAALAGPMANAEPDQATEAIKEVERLLNELDGTGDIVSPLSKARREFRVREGEVPDRERAASLLAESRELFRAELQWRERAAKDLAPGLAMYDKAIKDNIGLRLQKRLRTAQAEDLAECLAHHRDISLNF
ncbi:MAG: TRAP transporter large permease subunit [Gammaproteobacteria bacterium]|nr:TRAP transporter large permease subunit [Gammaproteobacteria bacterium]